MKKNMKFNFLFKTFVLGLSIVLLASCDKDYNEIGTDIIGNNHYNFIKNTDASVLAYNTDLGAVQSNNLLTNALGYYNNPVFGKTHASFVSQVELVAADPTFYDPATIEIDSVYLYVPYFSTFKSKDSETGDSTYELDSISGNSKFKLSVYESKYYLRDYDPATGLQEVQKYYSNQGPLFDANIGNSGNRLNTGPVSENDEFEFSNQEIKLTYLDENSEEVVKQRLAPGMFLNLDTVYFKNKIFNAPDGKLINNNVFKDYFRGLYFKAESASSSPDQGAMALMNFKAGKITIVYKDHTSSTVTTPKRREMVINLNGNTVNVFDNARSANYQSAISTANPTLGDEKLYLKGQQGSMAVIQLFGSTDVKGYDTETGLYTTTPNGIPDELDDIRANKWLVNEANLTFYIDSNTMLGTTEVAPEPNRIYLYDLENRRPLVDFYNDNSTASNVKYNRYVHGGIIEKEDVDNGRGIKYKIRITNHIRNLIINDSTNVKLGLVVTESIGTVTSATLKTPITPRLDRTPVSNVMNPLGTVLYGSKSSSNVPEDKRLKLEIYYTKPE